MKLRFLAFLLDIAIALHDATEALYLRLWRAHAQALPSRADDDSQVRRAVNEDWLKGMMQ
jgi:hypothetical protein